MLSLIVLCGQRSGGTNGPAEGVVRTLSAFVSASVRGLVRDAVLAGPPKNELGFIADQAGCAVVEDDDEADALRRALALGRAGDLLILHAGYIPEPGFIEGVEDLLGSPRGEERSWLLRTAPENFFERLFPRLAPAAGLIAGRGFYDDVAQPSFANLLRATPARPASRLRLRRVV